MGPRGHDVSNEDQKHAQFGIRFFYKKLFYKKLVLSCSKSKESSVLDF